MRTGGKFIFSFLLMILSGCSDNPEPSVAVDHLQRLIGNFMGMKTTWDDVSISDCKDISTDKNCVVSYVRNTGGRLYYEELSMNFRKTPSGWNVVNYDVIKTEDR